MSDIMEIIDERVRKKIKTKRSKWVASYNQNVRSKWFFCELDFVQLISKASLTFKSNLELAFLIILSESKFY